MGMLWKGVLLSLFVGDIAAQYARRYRDTPFPPDLSRFFENFMSFPFERNADIMPRDSILGSWSTPGINMFTGLPPIMDVPRVEVFCDDSELTVVVDKWSFGHRLTREEIQLGNSCYSNAELPDKFVFSYSVDQCGTTHVLQDGQNVFTNSLRLNLEETSSSWRQTPPVIEISCVPLRSPYPDIAWMPRERSKHINIKPMTLSWSQSTECNVYERGQVVNLQVSASIRPNQQLFVQSCFVSASSEPQTRPRHAVIFNKGCATPVGSPHPIVHFMDSDRTNLVNFVLNTSHLISKFYIHCNVLVSNLGATYGSKTCNYNVIQSRWEDLNGDANVCDCCSSKCKDLSIKTLSDTKAIVSTGPLVIVDNVSPESATNPTVKPQETMPEVIPNHTETKISDGAEDGILSGTSVSRCKPSLHGDVVFVSQDQGSRQTLWLPGLDPKDCDESPPQDVSTGHLQLPDGVQNDAPEQQTPTPQELNPSLLPKELEGSAYMWDAPSLAVNGWPIFPQPHIAIIAEEFKREGTMEEPVRPNTEMVQDDNYLPTEVGLDVLLVEDPSFPNSDDVAPKKFPRKRHFPDDLAIHDNQECKKTDKLGDVEEDNHIRIEPVVHAKIEFSKGVDGTKKLSYEEEVAKQREGNGMTKRFGRNGMRRREHNLNGLRSTFLSVFRSMDKSE